MAIERINPSSLGQPGGDIGTHQVASLAMYQAVGHWTFLEIGGTPFLPAPVHQ